MPKKKKTTKKKTSKKPEQVKESNGFGLYVVAVLIIIIAVLLLIGGFGTGGKLPIALYHAMYWLFGWAALSVPIALMIIGVYIFMREDHTLPKDKITSLIVAVLSLSGLGYVGFANKDSFGNWSGGHGGSVGSLIGGTILSALDKIPAAFVFFLIAIIAGGYVFGFTAKDLIKLIRKKDKKTEENDLESLKAKAESTFKLNEGVPIEHHSQNERQPIPEQQRLNSLKNTAQKLSKNETHEALTMASDPNWKFPSVVLLNQKQDKADPGDVNANAKTIHDTLANFNIDVQMEGANIGYDAQ